jgi:TetR/AcrR family transcriptional regulator, mexJK operon transcriptional repressor
MGTQVGEKQRVIASLSGTPARETEIQSLSVALSPALEDLPRVPRQARSREKREGLLRASAQVFAERGYSSTTADAIAEVAGVSVGTFYNYFRNKRQILLALVIDQLDDIFGHLRMARVDLSHGNSRRHIRAAVAAALRQNERSGLRRAWQELMSSEPDLVPYQQVIRSYAQQQLTAQLRLAQQRGGTWDHLDIEVTALAILALIDSLTLRAQRLPDEARVIEGVADMVYRAIYCVPS